MPVALVIGASRGIGREFARQLLDEGWQVFATARDAGAVAELNAAGAAGIKLDVTQPESLAALGWQMDGV
ncbi:MAG: SDR family NAD(P)-dependent oxidoreductase, partial [Lacisediminimonas sp.]|nr:SDR family NAD(P)-dependent oxidoreductase [Lacisediminimonas sp.]